jgi:hypothetical protein
MTRNAASTATEKRLAAPDIVRTAPSPIAALASEEAIPVPSGVHDLQSLLAERLDATAPVKWSTRATLGFVALVCGGFWAGVYLTVRILLR